jgi:hypothetical protein
MVSAMPPDAASCTNSRRDMPIGRDPPLAPDRVPNSFDLRATVFPRVSEPVWSETTVSYRKTISKALWAVMLFAKSLNKS